jgi:hypothetical protein
VGSSKIRLDLDSVGPLCVMSLSRLNFSQLHIIVLDISLRFDNLRIDCLRYWDIPNISTSYSSSQSDFKYSSDWKRGTTSTWAEILCCLERIVLDSFVTVHLTITNCEWWPGQISYNLWLRGTVFGTEVLDRIMVWQKFKLSSGIYYWINRWQNTLIEKDKSEEENETLRRLFMFIKGLK